MTQAPQASEVTQAKQVLPLPTLTSDHLQKFWSKVDRRGDGECWLWRGAKNGNATHKYGDFYVGGKSYRAHRIAYALSGHSISTDQVIDHLCRQPLCVNPAHLEAVTSQQNTLRGKSYPTFCKNGHPFAGGNVHWRGTGQQRACRQCGAERTARYKAKKRMLCGE